MQAAAPSLQIKDIQRALEAGEVVVTATARLARRLGREYDLLQRGSGSVVWDEARVFTWSAWIAEMARAAFYADGQSRPQVTLNVWQERALWESAVRNGSEQPLLDAPSAARSAQQAWKLLHEWQLSLDDFREAPSRDVEAFLGWAELVREQCRENSWLTAAELPNRVLAALEKGSLAPPRGWMLVGFDELVPIQRTFLNRLSALGCHTQVMAPASAPVESAKRVEALDPRDELALAARWARSAIESGASPVAVVVPNLSRRREEVERAFLEAFHPAAHLPPGSAQAPRAFHIASPIPLGHYPLIRAAFLGLELAAETVQLQAVEAFLQSPFFAGAISEWPARARCAQQLRGLGALQIPADKVTAAIAESAIPQAAAAWIGFRRLAASLPPSQTAASWTAAFTRLLGQLGWPGERALSSEEIQTFNRWRDLLDVFSSLEWLEPAESLAAALGSLRGLAAEELFQPEAADEPVEILGLLEVSGLSFDRLWVCGMTDEEWPWPVRPNPFLPIETQRRLGLPRASPEREREFAMRVTQRLAATAPEVVFSWPSRDGDEPLRPSPLIAAATKVDLESVASPAPIPYVETLRKTYLPDDPIDDFSGPPLSDGSATRGGSKVFEDQAACPFRAFAHWRLGACEVGAPQPGLTPPQRGALVHEALRALWDELQQSSRLRSLAPEAIAELATKHGAAAIRRNAKKIPILGRPRLAVLEAERITALLIEWLEVESERAQFQVAQTEKEQTADVGGLEIRFQPDRIDRLASGGLLLLDYKTGECSLKSWEGERPDHPQLPLYALIKGEELTGLAFAQVRKGKLKFVGYAPDQEGLPGALEPPQPIESLIAGWREALTALAVDYREGFAAVDPKDPPRTCQYCDLPTFCRINESLTAAEEDDDA